ncbi:MAG: hypothetical protein RDV48_28465 [Candidatus Eremiobacteraeota bacterium]|nr:hypothetical protein [Candidatus Eremiobacteraeota bacterium]
MFQPLMAQEYQNDNLKIELKYSPMNLAGDNGISADLACFKAGVEARVYRGMKIGVGYQGASGGGGTFLGRSNSNVDYSNIDAYVKLPMNLASLSNSYNTSSPTPAENDFFFTLGYKWHALNSSGSPLNQGRTWENGNGVGVGIGYDGYFEGVGLYVLGAYYPSMNANSVPNAVAGASYTFKDYVYKAGLKFKLRENIGILVGYEGETHEYSNGTLRYSGAVGGLEFRF